MPPPDLEEVVFSALKRLFNDVNTTGTLLEKELGQLSQFGVSPGVARPYLARLEQRVLLVRKQDARVVSRPGSEAPGVVGSLFDRSSNQQIETIQGPPYWELTPKGAELVYRELSVDAWPSDDASAADAIPAADRFVSTSDNSAVFDEARNAVAELRKAVQSSNELSVSGDDRIAVIQEIESIERLLSAANVRVAAMWQATRNHAAIGWLSKESGSGSIRALATAAVNWRLKAVGLG